jgi:hypothetical protein
MGNGSTQVQRLLRAPVILVTMMLCLIVISLLMIVRIPSGSFVAVSMFGRIRRLSCGTCRGVVAVAAVVTRPTLPALDTPFTREEREMAG